MSKQHWKDRYSKNCKNNMGYNITDSEFIKILYLDKSE